MPNPNDININASLGKTTASGPGPAALPDVQVERREPIDVQQAAAQLEGLRSGWGRRRRQQGNPTQINQGLVGGRPYMPPHPMYSGGGGGGFSQAPTQLAGLGGGFSGGRDLSRSPYGTASGTSGMDVVYGGSSPMTSFMQPSGPSPEELLRQLSPVKRAGFYGRDAYYPGGQGGS